MPPGRVASLMAAGADDPHVAEAGARAFTDIALPEAGRDPCVAVGAIPLLVAALTLHAGVAEVCQWASHALGHIAVGSEARKDAIIAEGAIPLLVAVLTMHAGVAEVCQWASQALGNIAAGSEVHTAAIVAEGAIPLLVAALTMHAGVAGVCQRASLALGNIAARSEARTAAIVAEGAIPLLVAALTMHAGVAGVCQRASGALWNMSIGRAGRRAVLDSGAVSCLVQAHRRHPFARDRAHRALAALGFDDNGALLAAALGPVDAVARLMAVGDDPAGAEAAARVVADLAADATARGALVAAGAAAALVRLLASLADNHPGVREEGVRALAGLARDAGLGRGPGDPTPCEALRAAGAVEILVGCLAAHGASSSGAHAADGSEALGALAAGGEGARAVAAGAGPALAAVWQAHAAARPEARRALAVLGLDTDGTPLEDDI